MNITLQLLKVSSSNTVPSLEGIRILDLTRVWAGPLATRIFGDYGAEVIKITDPRTPLVMDNGLNNKLNRNKKNIGLRLDKPDGHEIFTELVSISDIVIENFRPRVMRNLRLTYDKLIQFNPTIIMCSMPGFGLKGPYSEYPAFGTTAEALAGLPYLTGYDNHLPISTGIAYGDPVSGLNAVGVLMAALRQKTKQGIGQHIDIALAASPVCNLGEYFVAESVGLPTPVLNGNKSLQMSPHGVYPSKGNDQWIAVAIEHLEQWKSLVRILDSEILKSDDFHNISTRKQKESTIDSAISLWTQKRTGTQIMKIFQESGIAAGIVSNSEQMLEDPHLNKRGIFVTLEEQHYGSKKYDAQSIPGNYRAKIDWTPIRDVGQDSEFFLQKLLGYSQSECKALEGKEVVHFEPRITK